MKITATLLIAVLGFLVGLVGVRHLGAEKAASDGTTPANATPAEKTPGAAGLAPSHRDRPAADGKVVTGTTASGATPADAERLVALSDALVRLAPPTTIEPLAPSGRVSGSIVTAEGDPIPGIKIELVPRQASVEEALQSGQSLEAYLSHSVDLHTRAHATRMQTRSQSDGSFLFDAVAPYDYQLRTQLPQHTVTCHVNETLTDHVHPGDHCSLVATLFRLVQVEVLLPDGASASRATIEMDGSWEEHPWSSYDPVIRVPGGTSTLSAMFDGMRSPPVPLSPGPTSGIESMVLRLEPSHRLVVEVEKPVDVQSLAALVYLLEDDGTAIDPERLASRGLVQYIALPSMSSVEFEGLVPGRYRVGVAGMGAVPTHVESVEVPFQGSLILPVELPLNSITCVIHDDRGPWEDPVYFLLHSGDDKVEAWDALIDVGVFAVAPRHPGRWEIDRLSVGFRRRATRTVPVVNGRAEIQLPPIASVEIELVGLPEDEQPEAQLRRLGSNDDAPGKYFRGKLTYEHAEAGDYELRINIGGTVLTPYPITLAPGEQSLQVVVPPLHDLFVSGCSSLGHVWLIHEADVRRSASARADVNGQVRFWGLMAGVYTVAADDQVMTVDVYQDRELALAGQPMNAMRVNEPTPFGTEVGDLIISVGGDPLDSVQAIMHVVARIRSLAKSATTKSATATADTSTSGEAPANDETAAAAPKPGHLILEIERDGLRLALEVPAQALLPLVDPKRNLPGFSPVHLSD